MGARTESKKGCEELNELLQRYSIALCRGTEANGESTMLRLAKNAQQNPLPCETNKA
jgi:hypothetical protein